jgi:hypothetical protein
LTRALVVFDSEVSQTNLAGDNPSSGSTVSCIPAATQIKDSPDDDDLALNIGRIAQLSAVFMKDRYLEGVSTLCAQLDEVGIHRRPRNARAKKGL